MKDTTDSKSGNKLNLPALKTPSGSIAKKQKDTRILKSFDLNEVKKQSKVNAVLKNDSIKQQMHKEQRPCKKNCVNG